MNFRDALTIPDLDSAGRVAVGVLAPGGRRVGTSADTPRAARFRIASLTKAFTAVATIRAARAAGVDLDAPVVEVLPEFRPYWRADERITISHLLAQTSGLAATLEGADVARLGGGGDALLEAARLTIGQGSSRVPGGRWEYYNGNYFLAGALTGALAGSSYEDALCDLVLIPWGLADTSFDVTPTLVPGNADGRKVPEVGYPRGRRPSGGLISTADDILTFVEHVLTDPQLSTLIGTPRTGPEDPMRYGYGWAIGPSGQMYLNGRLPGYRSALLALPRAGLAAVAIAGDESALPGLADWLSGTQRQITGDELAPDINDFAA